MRRLFCVALALPLLGCNTPINLVVLCPTGAVLAQAVSVTKLAGGNAPANVVMTANMAQPRVTCDWEEGNTDVTSNIAFPIAVEAGPAGANAGPQRLEYFVAVIDATGRMITKRNFERFLSPQQGTVTEYVNGTTITLSGEARPHQFQILAGFQLTPAELAYNQTRRVLPATPAP